MDICPSCHVGQLQPKCVTYLSLFEGYFVTFPSMPAWLCDACGELTYDEDVLQEIDMLLGVDAELEADKSPRARRPAGDGRRMPIPLRRRA